ncbi:MAG: hypothetical protein NT126_05960 [Bacteroidetes bacterium]|nr:hypothetical protein [Bacteroidota bacterium]
MIHYKPLLKFLAIFAAVYIFFLLPQTGIDRAYEKFIRTSVNQVFNRLTDKEVIFLEDEQRKDHDTKLYLSNKSLRVNGNDFKGAVYPLKLRRIGFIATAFLIALILATPTSKRRKFFALFFGYLWMTVFVMVKLRIIILHHYTISNWVGLHLDAGEIKKIEFWNEIFARSNTNSYYFALIVWLAVSFSKTQWLTLTGKFIQPVPKISFAQKPPVKPNSPAGKKNVKNKKGR